jgi:hypothetical protein
MADKTIGDLTAVTTLADGDLHEIETAAGNSRKITTANLRTEMQDGLAIGSDVQAWSANLDEYAAVNPTTAGLALLDDADAAAQRTTMGAAASGAVTASGLTMATDRLLGRDTASTGAVEEIDPTAWFEITGGLLVPKFRGARIVKSGDQTANFTTATDVTWGTEIHDTDGLWDAGTPARFTIPASLNGRYANVNANLRISSTTADTFQQMFLRHFDVSNVEKQSACAVSEIGTSVTFFSATLIGSPLATGDYFLVQFDEESDTSSTVAQNAFTNFSIEIR